MPRRSEQILAAPRAGVEWRSRRAAVASATAARPFMVHGSRRQRQTPRRTTRHGRSNALPGTSSSTHQRGLVEGRRSRTCTASCDAGGVPRARVWSKVEARWHINSIVVTLGVPTDVLVKGRAPLNILFIARDAGYAPMSSLKAVAPSMREPTCPSPPSLTWKCGRTSPLRPSRPRATRRRPF